MTVDAARLAAVISPLRRALLAAAREQEHLPEIPDAQIEILRALPRGVILSPGELAARLGRNRTTISNLLAAMERAGLVARRAHARDRRGVEVVATGAALDWFDRFDHASSSIVERATAGLSAGDAQALQSAIPALERLAATLLERRRDDTVEEAS